MKTALELATNLFSDPVKTLYAAQDEDALVPAMQLAAAGLLITSLPAGRMFLLALVVNTVLFVLGAAIVWLAGRITGGSGSPLSIAQLLGVVMIPLGLANAVCGVIGLSIIATLFSWYVNYHVIKIGHGFSTFRDVVLAWVVANLMTWMAFAGASLVLAGMMR